MIYFQVRTRLLYSKHYIIMERGVGKESPGKGEQEKEEMERGGRGRVYDGHANSNPF